MSNERGCQCGQAHGACTTEFQYAVKLVCGGVDANTPGAPAAWGQYWTATNIHNPDKCKKAHFRLKVAVADPGRAGPVSAYYGPFDLGPDEAFEIDCQYIKLAWPILFPGQTAPAFVKGYLVIESDNELDVVAVYTGASAADKPLTTFQTERVQPRCVPVCEDLVLPLNTGFAAWQTVSPAPLGPVVPVNNSAWHPAPFGSQWVSQTGADGTNATPGIRSYELYFDLCSGFDVPAAFPIQVLVDDAAKVFLNNQPPGGIGGTTIPFNTLTTLQVPTNLLVAGHNSFRVEVINVTPPVHTQNPTGFALAGILRVVRGKCPCA